MKISSEMVPQENGELVVSTEASSYTSIRKKGKAHSTILPASRPETEAGPGGTAPIVVVLAQVAPRLGNLTANLELHATAIAGARRYGADLVVFPELSMTGYFLEDLVPEVAITIDSPILKELAGLSRGIALVAGCVLESEDSRFFNAALYFQDGELLHVHRKVYLPTYGLFDEQRYFAAGNRFSTFSASLGSDQARQWKVGILICEEMWHPSAPGLLARQGVDLFICTSASPGRGVAPGAGLGTAHSYDAITRTYGQLYTSYLLYTNRSGYEDGVAFWGGSRVIGPDGSVIAEASRKEEMLQAELSLAQLRRTRIAFPLLRDERHDLESDQ